MYWWGIDGSLLLKWLGLCAGLGVNGCGVVLLLCCRGWVVEVLWRLLFGVGMGCVLLCTCGLGVLSGCWWYGDVALLACKDYCACALWSWMLGVLC